MWVGGGKTCLAIICAVAPLGGIYYPISTLPDWLQPIAYSLPSAHVFEGMRAAAMDGVFLVDRFIWSVSLNVLHLGLGMAAFLWAFRVARHRGQLLQMGE